jgi:arginase family enzyme
MNIDRTPPFVSAAKARGRRSGDISGRIDRMLERVDGHPIYVSIDIDVLDSVLSSRARVRARIGRGTVRNGAQR